MSNDRKLNVSEADFLTIKNNLKAHLKNQTEFVDYNFEGSAMNTLLDILAYATHYNTVHTNLAFGEMFLDSAVQRGSVVSRAKELGYLPRSKVAAKAIIRLSFSVAGNPSQYVLPKGTKFTSTSAGNTYTFVTAQDQIINNNGSNIFSDYVEIYQGNFATYSYTVNLNNANQRLIIPSKDIDKRFLAVFHKDTALTNDYNEYSFVDNLSIDKFDDKTQVYFLKESFDGFYEVYFGDGVIGKALENGNIVEFSYLLTDGAEANGAKSFSSAFTLPGVSGVSIITEDIASGGGERESIESIKYLAPFYYQSQGRAVTEDDYKSLILNNYPDIEDITVWGGEKNIPPFYGKVFIAIKPTENTFFSNAAKQAIQNDIISKYNIVSVRPEIVDPDYIDVAVNCVVTYNGRLYNRLSGTTLDQDIRDTIIEFFNAQTNKFAQPLYYSKLVAAIDGTSSLILNSVTNLTLEKFKEIYTGVSGTYTYTFNNSIHPGSLTSNEFIIGGITYKFSDIPNSRGPHSTGTLGIYRTTDSGTRVYLTREAGTLNYNTGEISINNIKFDSIVGDAINKRLIIKVSPGAFANEQNPTSIYTDYNVYTNERDQIIRLKENEITLTLLPDNSV